MNIISFWFMLFICATFLLYYIIPKKWQWVVLLVANVIFYSSYGLRYLFFPLLSVTVVYWLSLRIEKINELSANLLILQKDEEKKTVAKKTLLTTKRVLCFFAIIVSIGSWVVIKYGNFIISNINSILSCTPLSWRGNLHDFVLPLGMSFFSFNCVGYLIDIYRGKYKAQRNWAKLFTFITFFPHIIEGPFSRYDKIGKTLFEKHGFSYDRLTCGLERILWGVVKKTLVADKLGVAVTEIIAHYTSYSGTHVLFAVFGYGIQLYADFSGYMDIMCGISTVLGLELAENFKQPYFAKSVDGFWRRWHITLGAWFKDYLFYPISMGKIGQKIGKTARKKWGPRMGKLVPGYFALIFVWTATGLWHGANWTFLLWGYLNLLVILFSMQMSNVYEKVKAKLHIKTQSVVWQIFCIIRTFILVCFFRFFSVAPNIKASIQMLCHGVKDFDINVLKTPGALFAKMNARDIYIAVIVLCFVFLVDFLKEISIWEKTKNKTPILIKDIIFGILIVLLVLFAGGNNDLIGGFMYANF